MATFHLKLHGTRNHNMFLFICHRKLLIKIRRRAGCGKAWTSGSSSTLCPLQGVHPYRRYRFISTRVTHEWPFSRFNGLWYMLFASFDSSGIFFLIFPYAVKAVSIGIVFWINGQFFRSPSIITWNNVLCYKRERTSFLIWNINANCIAITICFLGDHIDNENFSGKSKYSSVLLPMGFWRWVKFYITSR